MQNQKAFTLIELLVVISIIALLVAILMPALNVARQQATGVYCLSNQKNLLLAWVMYADDNNRLIGGFTGSTNDPWCCWVKNPTSYLNYNSDPLEAKKQAVRDGKLYPYVENVDVYHCPGDRRELKEQHVTFRSYSVAGGMRGVGDGWGGPGWRIYPHIKINQIDSPARKYVFVEETDNRGYNMDSWVIYPTGDQWVDPLAIWHNKKSTLGFADGHAEMHDWVDERTIEMSTLSISFGDMFYKIHPDSEDLRYMQRSYAYEKLD